MQKRQTAQALDEVQASNQQWWSDHTMSYDWKERIGSERFSTAWFEEIDRRLIFAHRLFAHDARPFGRIIPFDAIQGRRVLEIGCGMGLHTEHLVRAGADVTTIDISQTSVDATSRRMALKGLRADVRRMDAQAIEFADATFDFIWSWGVIHHSAMTGRIIREIHRVLASGGEARAMVYNLEGMPAYITLLRRYLLGFWRGASLDECLWRDTDCFTARYYTKDHLRDLFNIFFSEVSVESFGQDADAAPLPRHLRPIALRLIGAERAERIGNKRGGFLFVTASKSL